MGERKETLVTLGGEVIDVDRVVGSGHGKYLFVSMPRERFDGPLG